MVSASNPRVRVPGVRANPSRGALLAALLASSPLLARAQDAAPSRDTPAAPGTGSAPPAGLPANALPADGGPSPSAPAAPTAPAVAALAQVPFTPATPIAPASAEATAAPREPSTHLEIVLENGTSMRFGMLWQAQYEVLGNSQNDDYSKNLFLRRFALQLAGTVLHRFEYFFDTDFTDLLKASGPDSVKNGPNIATKDALVTFRVIDDALKIEGGLLLPPGARSSLVGGAILFNLDFFRNTFRHGAAFNTADNSFARDLGLQLRGVVAFQGRRNVPLAGPPSRPGARNSFRAAGRLQLNLLDPELGYLYAGTYLGKKRILSFGLSADYQHETDVSYLAYAADGVVDLPLGPGILTGEIDVVHRDGGELLDLPEQTALSGELGYRIDALELSPVVRYEHRWMDAAPGDETALGAGIGYWPYGHTSNLKLLYQRIIVDGPAQAYNQLNLQWQLFFF
jgi:hypothetical protein